MQLRVNTKHEKATLGDLFGIFFEDLNPRGRRRIVCGIGTEPLL